MSNLNPPSDADELSAEDLELLGRARQQRQSEGAPAAVRERLLARAIEEVKREEPGRGVSAGQFVAAPPRGWGFALGWAAGVALAVVSLTQLRAWLQRPVPGASLDISGDISGDGAPKVGVERSVRQIGERSFQSALFHAPAQQLSSALPSPAASLFAERPFSPEGRAWQVRFWNDLGQAPSGAAPYEFAAGALCVGLGSGERVIGGWPWLDEGRASAAFGPAPPASAAPPPVRLVAGRSYRLAFRAWAREPLPAQVLIAVGHDRVPFSAAAGARVPVSSQAEPFVVNFVAAHDDPSIGVAFLATGADASERTRVCLSDVSLSEGPPL